MQASQRNMVILSTHKFKGLSNYKRIGTVLLHIFISLLYPAIWGFYFSLFKKWILLIEKNILNSSKECYLLTIVHFLIKGNNIVYINRYTLTYSSFKNR